MNPEALNKLFISNFGHEAQLQQGQFFGKLAQFIYNQSLDCFVLAGYAGTGKTTVVKSIVTTYTQLGGTIILLAPTGRASKVLSQRTEMRASTIHRHIYAPKAGGQGGFALRANRFKHALFVVDEASMIADRPSDTSTFGANSLLDDLIDYVRAGHKCKLLFIGDVAQLPPVGLTLSPALSPDILTKSYYLNVVFHEFTQVIRQAQESLILKNATKIREILAQGKTDKPIFEVGADVIRLNDPYLMEEVFGRCFGDAKSEQGIMVVSSNKRANQYNLDIRSRIQYREDLLSTTDQLMVVKNNYFWLNETSKAGFIANGDAVEVLSLRNRQELYGYTFTDATVQLIDYPDEQPFDCKIMLDVLQADGPALPYNQQRALFDTIAEDYPDIKNKKVLQQTVMENPFYNALQVKFAHVVTCHKAQGGQWPEVIIEQSYLPEGEITTEYLRWLYTALTRAQNIVYLVGFDDSYFNPS